MSVMPECNSSISNSKLYDKLCVTLETACGDIAFQLVVKCENYTHTKLTLIHTVKC